MGAIDTISSKLRLAVLAVSGAALLTVMLPARAEAFVYWTNFNSSAIGRADLDGTGVNQDFTHGFGTGAVSVAVDAAHIYWVNLVTNAIGRANIDGSNPQQVFIGGASEPEAIAVDGAHIYWANFKTKSIGRANLDGSGIEESFIAGANSPTGVAVDSLHRELPTTSVSATSLSVTCAAAKLILSGSTSCTATVADRAGSAGAPTGTVAFGSNGAGAFGPTTSCSLVASGAGAVCQLTYTPAATGNQAISATYAGDLTHGSSSGGAALLVIPSNVIALARPKLDRRRGTATLTVTLPGPGTLVLRGSGVRRQTRRALQAGKVNLAISPRRKTAKKLKRTGSAKVRVKVTYTPTGGDPSTRTVQVPLKFRR